MPKFVKQRQRIFALYRLLYEETDESNALTMGEILDKLSYMGISAERRAIYDDIRELNEAFPVNPRHHNDFSIEITTTNTNPIRYYLKSRELSSHELSQLADSMRMFRYITKGENDRILKKLERLCPRPQLSQLNKRNYILFEKREYKIGKKVKDTGGVPNPRYYDGNAFDKMDFIQNAIHENKCISFSYTGYILSTKTNQDGTVKIRRKGKRHDWVSPFALTYLDGDFYLIAVTYSENQEKQVVTRFCIDKMKDLEIRRIERQGARLFNQIAQGGIDGMKQVFSNAQGQVLTVELICKNTILDSIIERFGEDVSITRMSKELFCVKLLTTVNQQFIGWVLGFGADVRISKPPEIVELIKKQTENVISQYKFSN